MLALACPVSRLCGGEAVDENTTVHSSDPSYKVSVFVAPDVWPVYTSDHINSFITRPSLGLKHR